MKTLFCALRSIFFTLGYVPFIIVFSLISCTVGLLMPYRLRQDVATTGNWLIIHWLRLCCGVKFKVIGLENLPASPYVVLSKHQSSWETYFLQRALRPVSTILKRELLKVPIFGWGLASVRPIAIDRSNPRQALKDILTQGKQRLKEGSNVIVYPEGTRTPYGEKGNYGRSGAALAVAASVPVVPIAHNAGRCWPPHHFIKWPGTITVVIGNPLDSTQYDSKQLSRAAELWIESTQQQIS